jgi:formylglycine-generating enzyme required for sulfatase activity
MTASIRPATSVQPPDLISIPAGSFWMGDDAGRPDERPARLVWVDAFAVARLPVTNVEYAVFLAATGHEPPRFWDDIRFNAPEQPVVAVSWHDAVAYCDWFSDQIGRHCRLPSEAAWERAARGGHERATFPWGEDVAGWSADPALAQTRQEQPNPVGLSRPNGFGLLDMGYNVHEWCSDWYAPDYYHHAPDRNPTGPEHGTRRASRGGAWRHQIQVCRNAARSSLDPGFRYNDYGFRVFADEGLGVRD